MLRLPPFRYLAPRSLEEAEHMLAQEGDAAMLVAGGTDLFPNMKRRQFTPQVLIGLRAIKALKSVSGSPDQGFRLGASVTLTTIAEHPALQQHYSALATAANAVSTPQLGKRFPCSRPVAARSPFLPGAWPSPCAPPLTAS